MFWFFIGYLFALDEAERRANQPAPVHGPPAPWHAPWEGFGWRDWVGVIGRSALSLAVAVPLVVLMWPRFMDSVIKVVTAVSGTAS